MPPKKAPELPIVVMGSGAVGKSCLAVQYQHSIFEEHDYDPTIEDNHRKEEELADGRTYCLNIRDTAGEPEFIGLLENAIEEGEGFMIVYSIIDKRSFEEVVGFMELIQKKKGAEPVPIMLIGNKCDCETERVITTEQGQSLAKHYGITFFETSAKTGEQVKACFISIAEKVKESMINSGKIKGDKNCTLM